MSRCGDQHTGRARLFARALMAMGAGYLCMCILGVVLLFFVGPSLATLMITGAGLFWGGVYWGLSRAVQGGRYLGASVGVLAFKSVNYLLAGVLLFTAGASGPTQYIVICAFFVATALVLLAGVRALTTGSKVH